MARRRTNNSRARTTRTRKNRYGGRSNRRRPNYSSRSSNNNGIYLLPVSYKVAIVGDNGVGKSTLVSSYQTKSFFENAPKIHTVTIEEEFENRMFSLEFCDTDGSDEYDRLRPLSYTNIDTVLILFSVVDRSSFNAVRAKWYPEITQHCPNVPIILVGTKLDLVNDTETIKELNEKDENSITHEEGVRLAFDLQIERYVEITSYQLDSLNNLIDITRRLCLRYRKPKKMGCVIL